MRLLYIYTSLPYQWFFMEMWKMMIFALLFTCSAQLSVATNADMESYGLSLCSTNVEPYSSEYNCEEYNVTTADGFRLGVQRINSRSLSSASEPKGPVFLNHGLLTSGQTWVVNPPDESDVSPAFVLADAGYDVWIGNGRTTSYSHGHEYLTEKDEAYWNWSLDELAAFDLPSMLHLVSNITNKKIHFIGHSQGAQSALAALSEGNLLDIIYKVALLAPVAYVSHIPIVDAAIPPLLLEVLGMYDFNPKTKTDQEIIGLVCSPANLECIRVLSSTYTGPNCCINNSRYEFFYESAQATSTKNLIQFSQLYRAQKFQKYDYGAAENNQKYNSIYPPAYDLSRVPTQNLFLAYGGTDPLADPQDVERLKSDLRAGYKYLLKPKFAHLDFVFAINCKEELYDNIIAFFENE